jgi:hypothetical protein
MPSINATSRLLFSIFVAALCTPIIILFWQVIRTGVNFDHGYLDVLRSTFGGFMVYGIASEGVAFVLGLPTFLLFRRLQFVSWPLYAVGGAAISTVASVALTLTGTLYFFTGQSSKVHAWADSLPLFILCGITSSLIFWAMIRPEPVR